MFALNSVLNKTDIYNKKFLMKKSELKEIIKNSLVKEADGILSNSAKNAKRQALTSEIRYLRQQISDKTVELNSIR
jgi:hypothetical protein